MLHITSSRGSRSKSPRGVDDLYPQGYTVSNCQRDYQDPARCVGLLICTFPGCRMPARQETPPALSGRERYETWPLAPLQDG